MSKALKSDIECLRWKVLLFDECLCLRLDLCLLLCLCFGLEDEEDAEESSSEEEEEDESSEEDEEGGLLGGVEFEAVVVVEGETRI